MSRTAMTHEDLQHLEHANKVLLEHLEIVQKVVNETEGLLNNYLPIMRGYVDGVARLRQELGTEVAHILKSSREVGALTGPTENLLAFGRAVESLDRLLTPQVLEKLRALMGQTPPPPQG